jgi:predicted GNAT family N-acyltransferase
MPTKASYRQMAHGEEGEVCTLVVRVFHAFVAPDFSREGVEEFLRYACPDALSVRARAGHIVFLAEEEGRLVGMLELKPYDHIAMLFVEAQGRGIGKELVRRAVNLCREHVHEAPRLSVHASRYALPIYRQLGFETLGPERTENGITYVPMALHLREGV